MTIIRPGVDRREETETLEDIDAEHTTQVVEDVGAEQALIVARIVNLVWVFAGALEVLLGLRFLLKLIAANPNSGFASFIYGLSDIFLLPFRGLTLTPTIGGMVLEIPTLIAILAYALLFWIISEVMYLVLSPTRVRSARIFRRGR